MLGSGEVSASATAVLSLTLGVRRIVLRTALTPVLDLVAGEVSRTLALR